MIIACKHPNGLNCGGVVLRGPAVEGTPIGEVAQVVGQDPTLYGGYRLNHVDDVRDFPRWAQDNAQSDLVRQGVVVWGDDEAEVKTKIFEGRRSGSFASGAPAIQHVF